MTTILDEGESYCRQASVALGGMEVRSSISYVIIILNKFLAGATVQVLLFAMVNRFLRILNFRIDPAFLACR